MSSPAEPAARQPQAIRRPAVASAATTRYLGAAVGAATGPVAAFGQGWAGTGDGGAHIWVLATVCGALLGALTYPLFWGRGSESSTPHKRPGGPTTEMGPFQCEFAALFGFAVGLVAGAFVAFPMGSVVGAFGGALAGGVVAFLARRLRGLRFALPLASLGGAGVALLAAWSWLS